MEKELLQQFRDQVKTIDLEIIYLLSRRFENVKQIWALKKELNLEIHQEDIWNTLLADILEESKERFLDEDFIKNIWNLIHAESKKYQEK
jgi:chorismate mutase